MNILNRLYSWYGRRNVIISISVIAGLILTGLFLNFFAFNKEAAPVAIESLTNVTVSRVDALRSESNFRVTGIVRAVSEARLQAEASGRVTSVTVALGDTVRQGTVIATIENNSERASLLQAEGSYDAAVAAARSSEIGVGGAKTALTSAITSGINTYQDAFITLDNVLHNNVDDYFSISSDGKALGFKLDGKGKTQQLNNERTALELVFKSWLKNKDTLSESNIASTLESAYTDALRISQFIETLTVVAQDQDISTTFRQEDKDAVVATMFSLRTSINEMLKQLEGANAQLSAAQKNYEQAQIAGSQNVPSVAGAQVKIALGSLRAAQANYEKTLVRTPISGVVNALYLKSGEYTNQGTPAAVIANNNALEITTALSTDDADMIEIGEEVIIDESFSGIVTAIAPAIDPISGKKEVKLSVSDDTELTNGSTVSVEFKRNKETTNSDINRDIIVPLSALKMTASGPIAFTLSPDNTLIGHPVVLGEIRGDMVVVLEGLSSDSEIVVDARGLKEGEKVEVTQ